MVYSLLICMGSMLLSCTLQGKLILKLQSFTKEPSRFIGIHNIGGDKPILGCSSNTCNEAVRADMGLDTL